MDEVKAMAAEMAECDSWFGAKFLGIAPKTDVPAHLITLANQWGPIRQNRSAVGRSLNIAGREYAGGLSCHALSRVSVHLPGPAKSFSAVVGVDSNPEWTMPGRGNLVFSVRDAGRELWRSPIMREGMPGVAVDVPLNGARNFLMEIRDGGEGIDFGQGDWADAHVALEDGAVLWLGDVACPGDCVKGLPAVEWPFSFVFDGRRSEELLRAWPMERGERGLGDGRMEHTLVWTDPSTALQVRCLAVRYRDFPTVEWTVSLRNGGRADTPIVEDIRAIDTRLERGPGGEFLLHHAVGSPATAGDYAPLQTPLGKSAVKRIATSGGRGSNSDWPYFNLEAVGEGTIIAVGWPGQWAAEFARDEVNGVRVRAGQETTHFRLRPGEEIRAPLMAVQFWKGGNWIRAQNIWRRWMVAHNLPRPGGRLPAPMLLGYTGRFHEEMAKANEENQFFCYRRYLEEKIELDYWWIDAGWYPIQGNWTTTGTWEVDKTRFPRGLRAISDLAHRDGKKMIVWFEPERVTRDSWLAHNHPEWLLSDHPEWSMGSKLLDLGNAEAWNWLVDRIDRLVTEEGIDIYRQDFNFDPLPFWKAKDAPDRQGIAENKHVCGYLAFWDELRRRHPDLLIDSCASGGRRNDLESMRRAVPLWRSDCVFDPLATQSQTYGISLWLPYYGTGTVAAGNVPVHGSGWTPVEPYAFWSNSTPSLVLTMDIREKGLDYTLLRKLVAGWRDVSPCYYGDFYPLTPYTLEDDLWIAWQFHRPDLGQGMLQCFRRILSPYVTARFKLKALDYDTRYCVTDMSSGAVAKVCGRELAEHGWTFTLADAPSAGIIHYKKINKVANE